MDSKSTNTFLVVAVALVPLAIGYSSLLRQRTQPTDLPDSELEREVPELLDEERITSVVIGNSEVSKSPMPAGPGGLQQVLQVMPELDRNNVFRLAIRDAGFHCDNVMSSQLLYAETGAWRADCGAMANYSILIDEFSKMYINPIPYGDFPPVEPE